MKSSIADRPAQSRAQFLAGSLALDFMNTRVRAGRKIVDLFQTSEDVLAWLKRAGLPASKVGRHTASQSLLLSARALRENLRSLVEKRKAGRRGDPSILNDFLKHAQSHPRLVWNKPQSLTIERIHQPNRTGAILAPVAEAAAVLLSTADFHLVKRCESKTCILWFLDQSKSHHRRWCSTRTCGNRHKVAAYRKRRRHQSASANSDHGR
jgi:predicted RNA-binding Zn ribbon-like protein